MCKQSGDCCLQSLGGEGGGFFWFSRPEGAKTNQPRATPWVPRQRIPGSPERAKQGDNRRLATTLLRPFRAEISDAVITQGGAPRLTPLRSALGCHVTPLRGKRRNQLSPLPPCQFPMSAPILQHPSHKVTDHFLDLRKMVDIGSGAQRKLDDIALAPNGERSRQAAVHVRTLGARWAQTYRIQFCRG
jgi:hypothetical protein